MPTPHPEHDIIYFARTNYRNQQRKFGIKLDDRRRHVYIIGKTGMGKTTVLENMMIQDVQNDHGLAVVDPHGDFVEKVLDFIPAQRINDVVYVNPADSEFPIAFNVLESINPMHRHLVASGLVSVFKKIWADSWGPRLEYILRNSILSLLEYPGSTLLGIPRILVDKAYRRKVVEKVTDPIIKAFWLDEFNQYQEKFRSEAIAPIQNKIGQFLSSTIIRNIVGQPKSTIDMREIMDSGKILLVDLAKGRIGEDNAALLGAMMITKIQLAAMSRVDIPEDERRDFFLYVDEFQNFSTESFATILSEARKYRLDIIIAHQYIEQLDETVQAAVFGNVGTLVCFRVGANDAEFLAKEFAPVFDETDLVNLTKFDIYLRLMIDGVASDPFSASTLPPISGRTGNAQKVITVSRERYANAREVVEEKIRRWSGVEEIFRGQGRDEDVAETRGAASKEEVPPPKMEELEPVLKETGGEISLAEALKIPNPLDRVRATRDIASLEHERPPQGLERRQERPSLPPRPQQERQHPHEDRGRQRHGRRHRGEQRHNPPQQQPRPQSPQQKDDQRLEREQEYRPEKQNRTIPGHTRPSEPSENTQRGGSQPLRPGEVVKLG